MSGLELLIGAARAEGVSAAEEARVLRGVEARHGVLVMTAFAGDSAGMRAALDYLTRARVSPAALGSALGSTFNIALVVAFAGIVSSGALVADAPRAPEEKEAAVPASAAIFEAREVETPHSFVEGAPAKPEPVFSPPIERVKRPAKKRVAPPIEEIDSSALEVLAVEEATRAIKTGDAGEALSVLDRFEARQIKRALLEEERTALRVRALCALERRDEARGLADRFAAAHPSSPLLRRLEACLKGGEEP
jgi:hypothetical protein